MMSYLKSIGIFNLSLIIFLFSSCLCSENYEFRVPVEILKPRAEYKIGDTLFFEVKMDRKMIYDSTNKESHYIPDFNPYLQVHNVVVDEFPTMDDLDSSKVVSYENKFEYIFYSARSSYGIRIDQPYIENDSISIRIGIEMEKLGIHMLYFQSPIGVLRNGFYFDKKCPNSTSDAYIQLLSNNNDYILSPKNKEVIDEHFSESSGVRQRSEKFYYKVVE